MPIRERRVKRVLPVIVRYFVLLNASWGRTTLWRLGMSKHQFIVGENHLKEWREEENGMCNHTRHQHWVSWDWASLLSQFTFASLLRMISALLVVGVNDNALNPIMRDSNAGKSNQLRTRESITLKHSTLTILECIRTKEEIVKERHVYSSFTPSLRTLQLQWESMPEIETVPPHLAHTNGSQCWCVLNLTHKVATERPIANPQSHQFRAVLQAEAAILPYEAILSNRHSFQLTQSNYVHSRYITQRVISNLK